MHKQTIAVVGIGRMGKGIALAFAYAGYQAQLIDSEQHLADEFAEIKTAAENELTTELQFLQDINVITENQSAAITARVEYVDKAAAEQKLAQANFIFEAVLELLDIKQAVYAWVSEHISDDAIVSSTTSTMSANDLCKFVKGRQRFINAHWLNPAHLMPLVEISPSDHTDTKVIEAMKSLLEDIGKVPVVCKASPGFIVSRIQAVALNEAARVVEEGVASAEDVDKAIKTGFGVRYATLGLLEFIDWGGGDILYHASNYLSENLDKHRFAVSDIVKENMANNHNGLRDGRGFYDWQGQDADLYRREKLSAFIRLLQHRDLMPKAETDELS